MVIQDNIRFNHGFEEYNVCCGPRSILMPDAENPSLNVITHSNHCMGPRGFSVQFVVDLLICICVAVTNHRIKMCIYSSIDYYLDFNLSLSVFLVLTNRAISRDCNI